MENSILESRKLRDTIYAGQLPHILNQDYSHIKILSLDCFDTLLWRMAATPRDVFLEMEHTEVFQSIGLTATLRQQAEAKARSLRQLKENKTEVTLDDIYREHLPTLTENELLALNNTEIAVEQSVCYAYPPAIELIRSAKHFGIKIIIVSDTYFTEVQLRTLLAALLPDDAMSSIDKIFCSSQYGVSKSTGLFNNVIHAMHAIPETILHIGDNKAADYTAPRDLKMHTLHLIQDNDYIKTLQRLHSTASNLINPAIRTTRPLSNPFRALFSSREPNLNNPASLLGYYSLGPIMYAFAQYIIEEITKIRLSGTTPKILFLMRDGYLPMLACQALVGGSLGHAVSISRFVSYAASFRTIEDIDRYLLESLKSNRFHDITRQLLLPKKVADPIILAAEKSATPEKTFANLIHRNDVLRIIFKKSAEYFSRLKHYLEKQIALKPGDTLLFIDLGYAGTAQRLLTPLFNEMGVKLEGRYLIALRTSIKESYRAGLLDTSHYDDKTIFSILYYISLLEQLCTSNSKSALDYDEQGNIICSDVSMSEQQHHRLASIQAECLQFIHHAKEFYQQMQPKFTQAMRREMVLAELARLIYFPTGPELHYLQSFQFDLNLGTKDIYPLFDPKKGLDGLKRRGLFYIDRNTISKRTHYPAELRIAGFELAVTFMSNIRFHLDANPDDMLPRKEFIEAEIKQQNQTISVMIEATATHDGYYAICVEAGLELTFCLGKRYQWLQIESAELIKEEAFTKQKEAGNLVNISNYLSLKNIKDHGSGLLECTSTFGAITLPANSSHDNTKHIFRLVYRPLVFHIRHQS